MSARTVGGHGPPLLASRGRARVSPELQPPRCPSVSAAAASSRHLPRCFHLGSARPPPCARAPHRPLPASLSLLFFPSCWSLRSARVLRAVGAAVQAPPPRRGPELPFARMAFLELGPRGTLDDVVSVNKVSRVNVRVCNEMEARVVS